MKIRVRHTKLGKVRFTSHRDTARHWERAVRKAGLSVAYSGGFTPRPKMSFGLALPTGAESVAEYLDIDLVEGSLTEDDLPEFAARCTEVLPVGYEVTKVVPRDQKVRSLQEDVVACDWVITVHGPSADELAASVAHVVASPTLMVERERKAQRSVDDIRPSIIELSTAPAVDDDPRPRLCATVATTGRGLRPTELVSAMFPALDAVDVAARVLRTCQWIERDGGRQELLAIDPVAALLETGRA